VGVNHFTWLTDVRYKNIDLMPYYKNFCEKNRGGYFKGEFVSEAWNASVFKSKEAVKMELFEKYGVVAAAGDRHLVEFLEGKWYLESPEKAHEKQFKLTSVAWRKNDLKEKLEKRDAIVSGEREPELKRTGEEGVEQIRALLGLRELTTNVNIPNVGQIPNLPLGAVVETNAVFRDGTVTPVMAGALPRQIEPLVSRICIEQEILTEGIAKRDLNMIFNAFANDPNVTCSREDAKKLFDEMCQNTKKYLDMYDI
jgi:alpha-galactosidase